MTERDVIELFVGRDHYTVRAVDVAGHRPGVYELVNFVFIDTGYMCETPAPIEAERGTFDATYLVYMVGKLAILKLRDDYKRDRKRTIHFVRIPQPFVIERTLAGASPDVIARRSS